METYTLYGRRGGKNSLKEAKICEAIVSKRILFILRLFMLSQKRNWASYFPFPFYIMNYKIVFLETFWNLDNEFAFEIC